MTHLPDIKDIICPCCERTENLSVHIFSEKTTLKVRFPVKSGRIDTRSELFIDRQLYDDKAFLRCSDTNGQTRITVLDGKISIYLHCQFCKKMYAFKGNL
jgi:hypothetical protein